MQVIFLYLSSIIRDLYSAKNYEENFADFFCLKMIFFLYKNKIYILIKKIIYSNKTECLNLL